MKSLNANQSIGELSCTLAPNRINRARMQFRRQWSVQTSHEFKEETLYSDFLQFF